MSSSLLVLILPVLLATVLLLCFVGCGLETGGIGNPAFLRYSTVTVLPTSGLVGYWPLGEPAGATTAVDIKSGHNGAYLSHVFPDEPAMQSFAAPGTFSLGNLGIVPGDTVPPHDNIDHRTTCMQTNGGYVRIPFDAALIPTKAEGFTLEAWVRAQWSQDDTGFRVVMTTFDSAGGLKGFVLLATPDNHWAAMVGNGVAITQAIGNAILFGTRPTIWLQPTTEAISNFTWTASKAPRRLRPIIIRRRRTRSISAPAGPTSPNRTFPSSAKSSA